MIMYIYYLQICTKQIYSQLKCSLSGLTLGIVSLTQVKVTFLFKVAVSDACWLREDSFISGEMLREEPDGSLCSRCFPSCDDRELDVLWITQLITQIMKQIYLSLFDAGL